MVETMMRLKPVALRTSVTDHLRRLGQSLGLEGSGVVKVTRKGSLSLGVGLVVVVVVLGLEEWLIRGLGVEEI